MKKLFTLLFLLLAIGFAKAQQTPADLGYALWACYDFNNNATDLTGHGHDGTVVGATATTDRNSNANSAYLFNGTSDYIRLNTPVDLPNRTINAWFFDNTITSTVQCIFDADNPDLINGKSSAYTKQAGGNNVLEYNFGAALGAIYDHSITAGNWNMVTVSYSGCDGEVRYYLNGARMKTDSAYTNSSGSGDSFMIIGATHLLDRFFNGKIDDVRIYDRPLSGCEVAALYLSGSCSSIMTPNSVPDYGNMNPNRISVFPNPMDNSCHIVFENVAKQKHTFILYDATGKVVETLSGITESEIILDRKNLPAGLYFYQLINGKGVVGSGKISME